MKMAIIVFMLFHWASELNPTFALARKLRNRGHHIHYFGIPDVAERIRSQGFDFTPVFSGAFPDGTLAKQYESEAQGKRYGISEFRDRFRGTCELLREGELNGATRHLHPRPLARFQPYAVGRNCGLQDWRPDHHFFQHLDFCRGLSGSSVQHTLNPEDHAHSARLTPRALE